jgi:tetratricopeptide (TPR) repeat protein
MRRLVILSILAAAILLPVSPAFAAATADALRAQAEAKGTDADLFARAASAYADAELPEPALELQQRAVALRPGDVALLSTQAAYANWNTRYPLAAASYREWLAIEPESAEAWLGLARVHSWQGSLDDAADSYAQYLELEPSDANARYEYALVLSYRGDYAHALEAIEIYRDLEGQTQRYHRAKASILAWGDRPDESLAVIRAGLELEPGDGELVCTEAVAWNQAREFRRSLERLDDCEALKPSTVDIGSLRGSLGTTLKPLGIRGIRNPWPYRPDYDWEHFDLLRPVGMADLHYRGDTENIDTVEGGIAAYAPIHPELFVGAIAGYEHLWAHRGSGFETKDGDKDIGYGYAAAELEARLAEDVWLGARLGGDVTTDDDASPRYRVALDARLADAWQIGVVQEHRLFSYSPRTVSKGREINSTQGLVRFTPDLRHTIEAGGGYSFISDDNGAWNAFIAPQRAVLRRQHLELDLGLRGQWRGFEERDDNGYYDPDLFQRYVATLRLAHTPREKVELNLSAAAGVSRDETTDGVEPAGDLLGEAILGPHDGWLLKLRSGVTVSIGSEGDYTGWVAGLRLVRQF